MQYKSAKTLQYERLRRELPYGHWTCADGVEVLFGRYYEPIMMRRRPSVIETADPSEWIEWEDERHFYDDENSPWSDATTMTTCRQILADFVAGKDVTQYWKDHEQRRAANSEKFRRRFLRRTGPQLHLV